jgi:GNAT superfamily N-acetyltransferase
MTTTTLVRTRLAGVHDLEQVLAMHRRCSPETLHRRFHVPMPEVPERLVRRLLSSATTWSLLAEQRDEVVGMACAGPVSDVEVEVGLLVADAHQGTGVGTRLMRDIAAEARLRGYAGLICSTQPDNDSVLRTVRRAGLEGVPSWSDGLREIAIPLAPLTTALEQPA